jgi:Trk K+ transport system NAD-binding subunit
MAKLHIKADILVASIIREKEVIIPKGDDFFNAGDLVVIVVTAGRTIESLSEIFETGVFEK